MTRISILKKNTTHHNVNRGANAGSVYLMHPQINERRTFAAAFSAFFFAAASAFNSFLSAFLDKGWPFSSSLTSATAAVADSTPLLLSSVICLVCGVLCLGAAYTWKLASRLSLGLPGPAFATKSRVGLKIKMAMEMN